MCVSIFLPEGEDIGSIEELERAFKMPVEPYYTAGVMETKDQCLCHVDLDEYLATLGIEFTMCEDGIGDYYISHIPDHDLTPPPEPDPMRGWCISR